MLFVPDIFALERARMALKKSLDILILTVEGWAAKRCCPTYMTVLFNGKFIFL